MDRSKAKKTQVFQSQLRELKSIINSTLLIRLRLKRIKSICKEIQIIRTSTPQGIKILIKFNQTFQSTLARNTFNRRAQNKSWINTKIKCSQRKVFHRRDHQDLRKSPTLNSSFIRKSMLYSILMTSSKNQTRLFRDKESTGQRFRRKI